MSDLGSREIMARNIQRLMDRTGKTRVQVCDDLGIKYTTFTDWIKGKTYPRIDKIELMANYFGVTKSALVEESQETPVKPEEQMMAVIETLESFRELAVDRLDMAQRIYSKNPPESSLAKKSKRLSEEMENVIKKIDELLENVPPLNEAIESFNQLSNAPGWPWPTDQE